MKISKKGDAMKRFGLILAIVCVLPFKTYAATYALLIGIDAYPGTEKLQGCVNDVHAMQHVLREKFNVPSDNIIMLLDEDATREAIEKVFTTHLIQQATKEDTVIVYYSGYGAVVPNLVKDKTQGSIKTLCPVNITRKNAKTWLTENRVNRWLKQLRTKHVAVILDTSYFDTKSRNPLDSKTMHFQYDNKKSVHTETSFYEPVNDDVFMASCAPGTPAYVLQDGSGSVFTTFLVEILKNLQHEIAYEALFRELIPRVQTYVDMHASGNTQVPQLRGNSTQPIFWETEISPMLELTESSSDIQKPSTTTAAQRTTINVTVRTDKDEYAVGDCITIFVRADRNCYLKLYDIPPGNHQITLLFPNESATDNFLSGGQFYTIPSKYDLFELVASPPLGAGRVVAVVSSEEFEDLRQMDWENEEFSSEDQTLDGDDIINQPNTAVTTYYVK